MMNITKVSYLVFICVSSHMGLQDTTVSEIIKKNLPETQKQKNKL